MKFKKRDFSQIVTKRRIVCVCVFKWWYLCSSARPKRKVDETAMIRNRCNRILHKN